MDWTYVRDFLKGLYSLLFNQLFEDLGDDWSKMVCELFPYPYILTK